MKDSDNTRLTYMTSEARCLEVIQEKGFTDQYQVKGKYLLCLNNRKLYHPHEIRVVNFYRFEGPSNPDDMSVIYAIETSDGRKGSLIDAFGVYADTSLRELLSAVEIEKKTYRGW